jgi:hypothetical protein
MIWTQLVQQLEVGVLDALDRLEDATHKTGSCCDGDSQQFKDKSSTGSVGEKHVLCVERIREIVDSVKPTPEKVRDIDLLGKAITLALADLSGD